MKEIRHSQDNVLYSILSVYTAGVGDGQGVAIGEQVQHAVISPFINEQDLYFLVCEVRSLAFRCCKNLLSVKLPDTIEKIGSYAFSECSGLLTITLPKNLKHIGPYAFCGCESIRELVIPDGVESIGDGVFAGCEQLEKVVVPASVRSAGKNVFADCKNLKDVVYLGESKNIFENNIPYKEKI